MLLNWRTRGSRRDGVMLGRMENQDGLYRGMKDRFAYILPEHGRLEFAYRGRVYRSQPGVLSVKHPGEFYRELRRDGLATFDIVFVDIDLVHAALGGSVHSEVVFPTPELTSSDPRASALLQLHALLRSGADEFARESAAVEAAAALAALARPRETVRRETSAVARARAYLIERLAEPVRLDELADHVGMDKFHLSRAFRAQLGAAPYEYLTHRRILKAQHLLREGWPVVRVASAVGYYDQSQLHRHFRRLVGVTPGAFARNFRACS